MCGGHRGTLQPCLAPGAGAAVTTASHGQDDRGSGRLPPAGRRELRRQLGQRRCTWRVSGLGFTMAGSCGTRGRGEQRAASRRDRMAVWCGATVASADRGHDLLPARVSLAGPHRGPASRHPRHLNVTCLPRPGMVSWDQLPRAGPRKGGPPYCSAARAAVRPASDHAPAPARICRKTAAVAGNGAPDWPARGARLGLARLPPGRHGAAALAWRGTSRDFGAGYAGIPAAQDGASAGGHR